METYAVIDQMVAHAINALANGVVVRWAQEGSAQITSLIGSNNAAISAGVAWLQLFSACISALFAGVLVILAMKRRELKASTTVVAAPIDSVSTAPAVGTGPMRERWNEILGHLQSPRENDWKQAVIEADKLVDDSLARAGFGGSTFGDRLTAIAPGTLVSLDGVWWAHKIRNRLAHEMDYFLRYTEARQAIGYYEAALAELQLL